MTSGAEVFDEHLGATAALFVAFAAFGWQIFGATFHEAGFGLEVGEGLGGEGEESFQAFFAGFCFGELHHFAADALIFVGGADAETCDFCLGASGVWVQGDTGDRVAVDFEEVIVLELSFQRGAVPFQEFLTDDGRVDEFQQAADVFFESPSDLLVFIGVDEGSDAFVGEDFGEDAFIEVAIDDVDAGDACEAGGVGMSGL